MGFSDAVRTCLRKYITFSGRAARPEYWWFFLFVLIAGGVASLVDMMLFGSVSGTLETTADGAAAAAEIETPAPISFVVSLALFLPHLAAAWRRMHDTGRSGWFVLLPTILFLVAGVVLVFGLGIAGIFDGGGAMDKLFTRATLLLVIPTLLVLFISPLIVLFFLLRPSQPGTNSYGPNPHEVSQ